MLFRSDCGPPGSSIHGIFQAIVLEWVAISFSRVLSLAQTHRGRPQTTSTRDPWIGKIPWRRKWQSTPVLLPGKFHGQRILVRELPCRQHPQGAPSSRKGGPPRQDRKLPCRQHPQGAPAYGWRGPPRQDRELGPEDGMRGLRGADDQPSGPAPACTTRSVMTCETQRWFPGDRTGSQAWRRPGG